MINFQTIFFCTFSVIMLIWETFFASTTATTICLIVSSVESSGAGGHGGGHGVGGGHRKCLLIFNQIY